MRRSNYTILLSNVSWKTLELSAILKNPVFEKYSKKHFHVRSVKYQLVSREFRKISVLVVDELLWEHSSICLCLLEPDRRVIEDRSAKTWLVIWLIHLKSFTITKFWVRRYWNSSFCWDFSDKFVSSLPFIHFSIQEDCFWWTALREFVLNYASCYRLCSS